MSQKYLEESLDMTVRQLLPKWQERILNATTYFGVRTIKNPLDFWVYEEIVFETKPDVIIEIGNRFGGSTLKLAHLCDLMGRGRVIGIDIAQGNVSELTRAHARVTLLEGDGCALRDSVAALVRPNERVLVIEDSSHTYQNTLDVLRAYSGLLKPGDYFIVEDSICHHGLDQGPKPGPFEAIETFLAERKDFVCEREREDWLLTWNPKGFLKRAGESTAGKRSLLGSLVGRPR